MKAIHAGLVAAGLMVGLAGGAEGQGNGRFSLPAGKPRQVRQPTAAERAAAVAPVAAPGYPGYPAYPVAYVLLPAVLMSDGRVYADFGYGYEPVARSCGAAVAQPIYSAPVYPAAPVSSTGTIPVVAGGGVVLSGGVQPPPVQTSRSYENLPAVQAARQQQAAAQASARAHSSCYRQDPTGIVVVVR